jgi:hypothetical protein
MNKFLLTCLLPFALLAQNGPSNNNNPPPPVKSPQEIQQELNSAEAQLQRAKEMFAPYYTGPLITPSPSMVPPGHIVVSPYLFVTDTYAVFDQNRHSQSLDHNRVRLHFVPVILGFGITDTMDAQVVWGGQASWQDGHVGGGIDDVGVTLGFLIQPQKIYVPQFKLLIGESFPTGKYQNLSTNGLGLDGTGAGAYSTQVALAVSKLLFWTTKHPVNTRLFIGYTLSTNVHVKNFNSYGGGFGTRGKIHPGNNLSVDFGLEVSLTQRWVIANDIVYSATNRTKFHGKPGTTERGGSIPAPNGLGYSDNLSLAPAIEYNWTDSTGIIAGAQFSVYGRNSTNFGSAVISWYGVY